MPGIVSIIVIVVSLLFKLLVLFVLVAALALLRHLASLEVIEQLLVCLFELPVTRIVPLIVVGIEQVVCKVIVKNHVVINNVPVNLLVVNANKVIFAGTRVALSLVVTPLHIVEELFWMDEQILAAIFRVVVFAAAIATLSCSLGTVLPAVIHSAAVVAARRLRAIALDMVAQAEEAHFLIVGAAVGSVSLLMAAVADVL